MNLDEIAMLDGVAQAELVRRGEVSPRELVDAAIERIERLNPQLGAVIHPTFDRARKEADVGPVDGPFAGVPFLLKDAGGEQAGEFSTMGMAALKKVGARAKEDSAIATFAREGGLIALGRTNTPELALLPTTEPEAFGPARNPWNLEHSSGGSSGGSGAAVAAGLVPVAHASDGGGSIRGPASKCGLIGLKPTRGRTSLGPERGEHWSSLSTHLVLSRTVRDTATALDCLNRAYPGDPYHALASPGSEGSYADLVSKAPAPLRIGYIAEAPRDLDNHPDVARAIDAMAKTLESLGHEVEHATPALLNDIEPTLTYVRIVAANVARSLDRVGAQIGSPLGPEDVEPLSWALAERGREIPVVQHLADIEFIHRFGREMARYQSEQDFDLLLTATQCLPPAKIGEITSTPDEPLRAFARAGPYGAFTLPFNLSGQPGISIPAGFTSGEDPGFPAGLPIGAQLVAPIGREDLLLRVAGQVEQERNWAAQRPPIFG
jgi:amidase